MESFSTKRSLRSFFPVLADICMESVYSYPVEKGCFDWGNLHKMNDR
jgi:hypothetical protein